MPLRRFLVINVMIFPSALMGLAGLHLFLFRLAGPAGPFRGTPEELRAKTDFFFPRQVWKDIVAIAVVFLTICSLAFIEPVQLLEQATPDPGDYHPEPEWYFLFLFQMLRLKVFSGELGQFVAGWPFRARSCCSWPRSPSSTGVRNAIFSSGRSHSCPGL